MGLFVQKSLELSGTDNYEKTIYLDNINGDDSTATIDDKTKPAKTLLYAFSMAKDTGVICRILLISDYILTDNTTSITKTWTQKCIITCEDNCSFTGMISATTEDEFTTECYPKFIESDGEIVYLSSTCHEYDVLNYIEFKVNKIISQDTSNSSAIQSVVTMDLPTDYNVAVGQTLDIKTGWVNALGYITAVEDSVMTVNIESKNYALTTASTGYYRITNYSDSDNSFTFTKSEDIYTIVTNRTNVKILQNVLLSFHGFNFSFINCNFYGINRLSYSPGGAIRFINCRFDYTYLTFYNVQNFYIDTCYFNHSDLYSSSLEHYSIIRNSLFKCSNIQSNGELLFEYNEVCYNYTALYIARERSTITSPQNAKQIYNAATIQYNNFHHIGVLLQSDYGVIYAGAMGYKRLIQYNHFHECLGRPTGASINAIYNDEGACGTLSRYNKIINCANGTHTHYSYGCVLYNNLFAYSVVFHFTYTTACYQGGTSFIGNIFYNGKISSDCLDTLDEDGAMFQMNLLDEDTGKEDTIRRHSNYVGMPDFTNPANGDFSISGTYTNNKISMGSTTIRNKTQSTIDSTFLDKNNEGSDKITYGLLSDNKWASENTLDVSLVYEDVSYPYDKWFILAEMKLYNIENDYLTNIINQ